MAQSSLLASVLLTAAATCLGAAPGEAKPPRMHFADAVSGRPYSKDPAVVRFQGRYWLYYSLPPYEGKATRGWSIGVATSENLVDWSKVGELRNTGDTERNGFCAPGAIVLDGRVHLFYQTYGNRRRDAICHAWSDDGLHFTRNPTNPIFQPTGDWNCGRAIDADVIADGDRLLLYWATRDPDFKIQMQGVAAAPLASDFGREQWTQLNLDGPILKPELPWEGRCIEAAAMARHDGRFYMFYAGDYNNAPQQVGVAVSDDGVRFTRLFDEPFLPNGPPGSWNSSESGHPFLFQDDDGRDYLFYQGNNDKGRTWYLSVVPIDWQDGKPIAAPERLPASAERRPNVLWIITDDHSRDDLGCYGNQCVKTPHIDRLARQSTRYTRAFAAAPTCAPTRSGLITGMYPISIGAHNQRNDEAVLPPHVRLLPQYLKEAGYFCVNAAWNLKRPGKTDYQFQWDRQTTYERATDWAERAPGQPFFAQVQIPEPHRPFTPDPENPVDPDRIALPPQYPDDPVVRLDFAQHYEEIQVADRKVGEILRKLEAEGDAENTVVFFFSDQGRPFPRGKQFLYDEGLAIPLIVRWPGKLAPGSVCDDLVSMIDFAPTCLSLAGLDVPEHMHGAVFLGDRARRRECVFASRDRVDDAVDRIRCLRTERYKYIRNFYPELPYDQDETYMVMMHPTLAALKKWHAEGRLDEAQSKWMVPRRPEEELYDLDADPHEFCNLADDPKHRELLVSLRRRLDRWIDETNDHGRTPEPEERLESIRREYRERLAKTLRKRGLTRPDELYDYWRRTLEPTRR